MSMIYSPQDWFFRIEFLAGQGDDETLSVMVDDGTACEDHVVTINLKNIQGEQQLAAIMLHEFQHALVAFMARRRK